MQKQQGFSLVLLLMCVAILGTCVAMWSQYQAKVYDYQQSRKLVTISQTYAKLFGKYLHDVDENNLYVMTGISDECRKLQINTGDTLNLSLNDLQQNFGTFKENPSPLDLAIRCNARAGNYMTPELTGINLYNQIPCIGVSKTQSGELQSFLFWVTNNAIDATPIAVAQIASLKLGGYIDSSLTTSIIKSRAGWTLDTSSPIFANIAQCGASMIAPNSVIINMQMSKEYNQQLSDDMSLSRESDNKYILGDVRNRNTSKANIYFSENGNNHAIVFNTESNVRLVTQNNEVTLQNGNFTASSLRASTEQEPGSSCNDDEIGTIAQQAPPPAGFEKIQQSNVVCTKSKIICSVYGTENCWIPVKGSNIVYNDPKDEDGNLVNGLYCPAYSPTAIDGKGGFDGEVGFYEPTCKIDLPGQGWYSSFSGADACSGGVSYTFGSNNIITGIVNQTPVRTASMTAQSGQYLQSSVTLDDGKTYKINRGYIVDSKLPSCVDMCKTYTRQSLQFGVQASIANGEIYLNNERYCYCGFPSQFMEKDSPSYAVKPIQVSSYVKSLTCTSKIIINGD